MKNRIVPKEVVKKTFQEKVDAMDIFQLEHINNSFNFILDEDELDYKETGSTTNLTPEYRAEILEAQEIVQRKINKLVTTPLGGDLKK